MKRFVRIGSQFGSEFIDPCEALYLKKFAKTVKNTKNRSVGIVLQYKFAIKPPFLVDSQKRSNIKKKKLGPSAFFALKKSHSVFEA